MAWTTPKSWSVREKLTAALMNTHLRDNLQYLYDLVTGAAIMFRPSNGNAGSIAFGPAGGRYARLWGAGAGPYLYITANGYFNGTSFNRDDTGTPLSAVYVDTTTPFGVQYAPAGANPATLTNLLTVDTAGGITGLGFYNGGEVTIANGATANIPHGLGVIPRYVRGAWENATSATHTRCVNEGFTPVAASVTVTSVGATNIVVTNNSGATAYVQFWAMR